MRWTVAMAAMATLMLAGGSQAAPASPLLGEWQDEQPPRPDLLGYRNIQFGPDALIFDRGQSVAVHGYDVDGAMIRVRTAGIGDLLFVLAGDRLCLAQAEGLHSLRSDPQVTAGDRCFKRREPHA